MGNIHFVNGLAERGFRLTELPAAAVQSYYVDYFATQLANGGLSQFVYNSRWEEDTIRWTREGLASIGATVHAQLFAALDELVRGLGDELPAFLASGYFGDNPTRDRINAASESFAQLSEVTLVDLNHAFLGRCNATLIDLAEWDTTLESLAATIPDRDARLAAAEQQAEASCSSEGDSSTLDDLFDDFHQGPLFERAPDAPRPGPYSNETSTEIIAPVSRDLLAAWLRDRLGPLTETENAMGDLKAQTGSGWTLIHLLGSDDSSYLGIEDTPDRWPSSRAVAEDLANHFRVIATLMPDAEDISPQPQRG